MRITVFGAGGNVGRRVLAEAAARGHHVTAVHRPTSEVPDLPPGVRAHPGDAADADDIASLSAGQDVVITATRPQPGREDELVGVASTMLNGLSGRDVRLIVVGGAATLGVPDTDRTVLDDPEMSTELRAIAQACADQLAACRAAANVDWTYVSPPSLLAPGTRTGQYRLGADELIVAADGRSTISLEDFAVAVLDEAERPGHRQTRFTVGY